MDKHPDSCEPHEPMIEHVKPAPVYMQYRSAVVTLRANAQRKNKMACLKIIDDYVESLRRDLKQRGLVR